MSAPDPKTCEVKIAGKWHAVSVDEAAESHVMAQKRCPICFGQVMIGGAYSGGSIKRSLYHRRPHTGCPLIPARFSGTPTHHPQALS